MPKEEDFQLPRRREAAKNVNYNEMEIDTKLVQQIQIAEKVVLRPRVAIAKLPGIVKGQAIQLVETRNSSTKNSFMIRILAGTLSLHYPFVQKE